MKKMQILIIIFLFPLVTFAQMKVTGRVIDEMGIAVEFTQVTIFTQDSVVVKSGLTNEIGEFKIETKSGTFLIQVIQSGLVLYKNKLELNANIDLGVIKVEISKKLKEVTVLSSKKWIERKSDRLIFNVENSIGSNIGDAIDILNITPGLRMQDDKFSIVGKSNVEVLVNNKRVLFSGDQLLSYLKSIRSENISKIEIITNPSSKYDAEGNSGLLNIVLKKNPNVGLSGNSQLSTSKNTFWSFGNGLNLNYQTEALKVSWRGNWALSRNNNLEYNKIIAPSLNSIENNTNRDTERKMLGSNLSLDYKFSPKSNAGFVYSISKNSGESNGETATTISTPSQVVNSSSMGKIGMILSSLNIYYTYLMDKKGTKANVDFNYITNQTDNIIDNISQANVFSKLNNNRDNDFTIKTGQLDFELPNKWCKTEFGAKFTSTNTRNFINTIVNAGQLVSNDFTLDEHIGALYLSANKEINPKWTVSGGLRFENTNIEIRPQDSGITLNNYNNLFPTISILFNQSEESSWSLNYNKRINRPKYQDLNPYKFYSNSFSYTTGNPFLRPSVSHNLELGYTHNTFNLSLYGSKILDEQGTIASLEGAFQAMKLGNFYTGNSFGLNVNYSFKLFEIWESVFYADISYNKSTSSILQQPSFEGWGGYLSSNNNIVLNKTRTLIWFLNFWQTTYTVEGYKNIRPNANLSSGMRYSLLNKKLQLSLTVSDTFRQEIKNGVSIIENGTNEYRNYYDAQRVAFSINYMFGNNRIRGNQKKVSSEEQSRTVKE
jgi:hypothetical protein